MFYGKSSVFLQNKQSWKKSVIPQNQGFVELQIVLCDSFSKGDFLYQKNVKSAIGSIGQSHLNLYFILSDRDFQVSS